MPVDDKASKYEKFLRLGDVRLKRVLADLRKLGNLANRQNYDYDDVAVDYLMQQITKEISVLRQKFNVNKDAAEEYSLAAWVEQSKSRYRNNRRSQV